jgi:hypothetical protein
MCSHRVQLCALVLRPVSLLLNRPFSAPRTEHHVAHRYLPASIQLIPVSSRGLSAVRPGVFAGRVYPLMPKLWALTARIGVLPSDL